MKLSPTLNLNSESFITLIDENDVEIDLLNNTDVVLDRVNGYSFFSSTDESGLSVYISDIIFKSFVTENSNLLDNIDQNTDKIIMDILSDRSNNIYILTENTENTENTEIPDLFKRN